MIPTTTPITPARISGRCPWDTSPGAPASCDVSAGRPSVGKALAARRDPSGRSRTPTSHTGHGFAVSDAARGRPQPEQAIVAIVTSLFRDPPDHGLRVDLAEFDA